MDTYKFYGIYFEISRRRHRRRQQLLLDFKYIRQLFTFNELMKIFSFDFNLIENEIFVESF